jgi:hypothetical protein
MNEKIKQRKELAPLFKQMHLASDPHYSIYDIVKKVKIAPDTIYKILKETGVDM